MRLYLVQHAKAASKEVNPERPLTEEGLRDIKKVAEFVKPLNLCVDYLWHSGKKRTVQTVEVVKKIKEATAIIYYSAPVEFRLVSYGYRTELLSYMSKQKGQYGRLAFFI